MTPANETMVPADAIWNISTTFIQNLWL
jgi:hypothetical protein